MVRIPTNVSRHPPSLPRMLRGTLDAPYFFCQLNLSSPKCFPSIKFFLIQMFSFLRSSKCFHPKMFHPPNVFLQLNLFSSNVFLSQMFPSPKCFPLPNVFLQSNLSSPNVFLPKCFPPPLEASGPPNVFLRLNLSSPKCFPSIKSFLLRMFSYQNVSLPHMFSFH